MRFEFDSVAELTEFFLFCVDLGAREPAAREVCLNPALAAPFGKSEPETEPLPEIAMPEPVQNDPHDVPAPVEQRRKRRTKAEMEAARAAEQAGNVSPAPDAATQVQATKSGDSEVTQSNASDAAGSANPFAQSEPTAARANPGPTVEANDITDAAEFIKSRLNERPEVSQVEHLNMARTFIGKHGMEKYNQSFALAGLTNNVMGYSPADCAAHAAALDFLSLE